MAKLGTYCDYKDLNPGQRLCGIHGVYNGKYCLECSQNLEDQKEFGRCNIHLIRLDDDGDCHICVRRMSQRGSRSQG